MNWQQSYIVNLIKSDRNNVNNSTQNLQSSKQLKKSSKNNNSAKNYNIELLFKLRYMFLLIGFYSVYSGFIYNDFISIMPDFFTTCYRYIENGQYQRTSNCTYIFGFDWVWSDSKNQIDFFNSFKMKFAVILGVLHMSLGICLKGANAIYFNEWSVFFLEF